MSPVIRVAVLLFGTIWGMWWVGSNARAQVELDLGAQDFVEVSSPEAAEVEYIAGLAQVQMDRGEAAAALATIAQGLVRYPDNLGLLESQADIWASQPVLRHRAPEIYRRLLTHQPDNLTVKTKLAAVLVALRQFDQAEALFQEILAAAPDNPEAHFGLGRLYQHFVFYTLSAYHFEASLRKMPENQAAREGLNQVRGLITPQVQALAGYFEDAEGFQRTFLYSSYRFYLHRASTLIASARGELLIKSAISPEGSHTDFRRKLPCTLPCTRSIPGCGSGSFLTVWDGQRPWPIFPLSSSTR